MKLAEQIRNKVKSIPDGKTFGYADLGIAKSKYLTAAKALERMQKTSQIKKLSNGVFYKPKQTVFGELKPDYYEQLRPYLFMNGKRIAYETGFSLYNKMGLTTQMAFRIKIASRSKRITINRGALKADAVKSYAEVTDENFEILGLLDAFRDIRRIPDCTPSKAVKILAARIQLMPNQQTGELISYALLYPPRVKALVGAVLENINPKVKTVKLKNSLNPFTKYRLGLNEQDLPTIKNWNIL